MELVERTHPLRVSFGEIIIYSYYMNTFCRKRIQKYRQSSHKCFTLSCRHLGNFSLVKNNTTNQLNIIVDHVPLYHVSSGHPACLPYCFVSRYHHIIVFCGYVSVKRGSSYFKFLILLKSSCC